MKPQDAVAAIPISVLEKYPIPQYEAVEANLSYLLKGFDRKIVVLDDDPTGVQTVHDVSIYTNWEEDTLREAFDEKERIFFILTNSRGFTSEQTKKEHENIGQRILKISAEMGKPFLLISRSDSTLRGHYPLETSTLRKTLEVLSDTKFDGEVICPFFMEGGRFTIDNVHYVREGNQLIPAGQTEFSKDKTFGYKSSHLGLWCEEKNNGLWRAEDMIYISLERLRALDYEGIEQQLMSAEDFNKIIVNAIDYADIKVFATSLIQAIAKGKRYMLRTAAAITKVLGGVTDKPLLNHQELVQGNRNGGIVLVGSHVNKTTKQLEMLLSSNLPIVPLEFDQHLVLKENGLEEEVERVVRLAEQAITDGKTAVIFTRRDRFDLPDDVAPDEQLRISVEISDAVTSTIGKLKVHPNFIVAKGGITSSDVGTKALGVRKARVLGQVAPGIPVWRTGEESKFPGMPYVIFPGNVGEIGTLLDVVTTLSQGS